MSSSDLQTPSVNLNIALGVCGGIAAYKAVEVLRGLQKAGCSVRVAMTKRACEFVQPLTFRALSGNHVVVDDYAPDNPDPIAHITFSQTADLLIVAPATANIIAKFANGVADDFLSSTYLACSAPVLIAPAMNTTMWEHPATQRNLERLRADGVHIMEPDAGEMAQLLGIPLKAGLTKDDFDRTMAVHPTAAEELVTMYKPTYRVKDGQRV